MKSRFAMTAMLVTGLLMSGTGAGLAVSGLDGTKDASVAQYGDRTVPPAETPAPTPTPPGPLPCDRNGDGVVDGNEDANGAAPGCEMSDGSRLPTSTQSEPTCDENGDGVISPSEAAKNGCGGVESETDANEPSSPAAAPAPASDSAPAAESDAPAARENAAQPNRQVAAADGDELPFTGFAAVPILVGGIALLGGGLVLRRRTA